MVIILYLRVVKYPGNPYFERKMSKLTFEILFLSLSLSLALFILLFVVPVLHLTDIATRLLKL